MSPSLVVMPFALALALGLGPLWGGGGDGSVLFILFIYKVR